MEEKKTIDKKKILIPIAVFLGLVILLVGVAFATGVFGGGNGKKEVEKAFAATFNESGDAIKAAWELEAYKDLFKDGTASINADLTVAEEMDLRIEYNMEDTVSALTLDAGYLGFTVLQAVLYMDENEISLGFPDAVSYVLNVDRTTLEEDVQNLVEEGTLDEKTADMLITLNEGSRDLSGNEEEMEAAQKELFAALKKCYDDSKFEKTNVKKLFVNGEERSCKGYVMKLTSGQAADFFYEYKRIYEENEIFQNYFNRAMVSAGGYDSVDEMLDYEDPAGEFEQLAKEAEEADETLEISFYIWDGRLAQIYMQPDEESYFEWNFEGGSFPLENTEMIFAVDGSESSISRTGSMEGDLYSVVYTIDADGTELSLEAEYDKGTGELWAEIYYDYTDMYFSGSILQTNKGEELTVSMDTLEIDGIELLSGEITVSGESGFIDPPAGDKIEVLKISQDELDDILEEITGSLFSGLY